MSGTTNFWAGFEKRAEEDKHHHVALPVGLAAGALTYGALRHGGKSKLTRTLEVGKRTNRGAVGRFADRLMYGADHVHYIKPGVKAPRKPHKVPGTVFFEEGAHAKHIRGQKNVGGLSAKTVARMGDKQRESQLLNKYSPKSHSPTVNAKVHGKGVSNLKAIHSKFKDNYFIKPRQGFASGIGGTGLVQRKDVEGFLAGKRISEKKKKLIEEVLKDPGSHVVQKDMKIKSGPISGSRELRVHAVGGKVIPGASTIRGYNLRDYTKIRKAEKTFQKFLDRLPAKHKGEHIVWNPDLAVTNKGMKIVELNRGTGDSGLLNPRDLYKGHGRMLGTAAAGDAIRNNQALYKHFTGRDSMLSAGLKATGVVGATAGTAKIMENRKKRPQP